MLRPQHRRAALLVAALSSALVSFSGLHEARAALPLVVTTPQSLDGAHEYSEITVKANGKILVKPAANGLGWLHLRANKIVIEAGGEINAVGAGYQGKDAADGGQPSGTSGAGKVGAASNLPGTGGANGGNGGKGTTAACAILGLVDGGTAYAMASVLELGSAGGAAVVDEPSLPTRGGHGGGRITLEAASITVDGVVTAAGENGLNPNNIGSGGGAGGVVQLIGGSVAGAGSIDVRGGAGGTGSKSGGGGGGGLVVLATSTPLNMLTVNIALDGGFSGECKNAGAGGKGVVVEMPGSACVDADADGFTAAACGGDDCDDADPTIHPAVNSVSVLERCDGQDNDCNGQIDDNMPVGACPGGSCQAGVCVASPDGTGGGDAGARPDHIEYVGGCALTSPTSEGGSPRRPSSIAAIGALLAALSAAAIGRKQSSARRESEDKRAFAPRASRASSLDASPGAGQTRRRTPARSNPSA